MDKLELEECLREAEEFFDGFGPFAWEVDEWGQFRAWIIVDADLPARTVAERRSAGGRRRP